MRVIEQLRQQLSDNETRKKLLNLLPSLVDHLEIDTEQKRYRIVNHADETSPWPNAHRSPRQDRTQALLPRHAGAINDRKEETQE